MIGELEKVARGETPRLMVNMPPGSAKSTYGSVLFPPWFLAQRPGLDMIQAGNTANMAEGFSRKVMGHIRDHATVLGFNLTRESVEEWTTTARGHYRARGIGGAIAGARADLVVIDDPVRTREDADSEPIREKQWNWFTGDLRTRLKPEAPIVVIMTRWHEDDLGGRLLDRQKGLWRVISLPAIAEKEDDPLGRERGEWLWDDDGVYPYGAELRRVHAEYEMAGSMRDWAALYQQRPAPIEGALFKTAQITTVDDVPMGTSVRAWDLAATEQVGTRDPDWTVGLKLTKAKDGRFVVSDIVRLRGGPDEVEAAIMATASRDGRSIQISLPQDPGQAGKVQVLYLTRKLAGYRVHSSPETGDKATRASPVAAQCNVGNLAMVRASWNGPLLAELAGFPSASKDDQVDALSRAFGCLTETPAPIQINPELFQRFARR